MTESLEEELGINREVKKALDDKNGGERAEAYQKWETDVPLVVNKKVYEDIY